MSKRRSAKQWRRLVDDWQRSGLSCKAYGEQVGVKSSTLGWWKWKLGKEEPAFLEVVVTEPPQAPDFVVELDAVRVRVACGFDAAELRRLVAALC